MKDMSRVSILIFAIWLAGALSASAGTIRTIRVEGNQRVDTSSIKSYLTFQEGDELDVSDVNTSVKALFATNLFSDVSIGQSVDGVVVKVVENPIISQVAFEGNKAMDDSQLQKEISLGPRSIYTKSAVQSDVQRISNLYAKSGKYNARVEPKVILKDQNRVDLVFEIDEGTSTQITKIVFIGNREFSDSALRGVVQSEETRWYKFLTSSDRYDADRIEYDKELLRRYYTSNGFADFKVRSAMAELNPSRDGFILTFSVDEGPKYEFGRIQVITQLADLTAEELEAERDDLIATKEGSEYDSSKVEKTVDSLTEKAGEKGFAFVDIDPQVSRDRENNKIDITYLIKEGPKVYIDRINIGGNSRTLDEVIRREFRVSEGDPFNSSMVKRSKQRIERLGFFSKVDVAQSRVGDSDKVDLDVNVKERSTGELNFGAGYSTVDGILGEVSLAERNFLGRGQAVRVSVNASTRRQQGQFSFTEPYFLGKDLAAGFDVYKIKRDLQTESSYDSDTTGLNLRMGYDIAEHLRHNLYYRIIDEEISDVHPLASRFIRDQEGRTFTSLVGHNFVYDTRNSNIDPTSGMIIRLTQDVAGLGGDVKFLRHEVNSGYYLALDDDKKIRLQFLGSAGNMFGIGEDIPINQRFFLGGKTFRGFERAGLGPRDISTREKDSLGGNNYYVLTTELGFPLGLPEELGLTGALFAEGGSLWGVDDEGAGVYDSKDPRLVVGAGIGWASPFGPIRIDFAVPVVKDDHDETESFQFNFGTRF